MSFETTSISNDPRRSCHHVETTSPSESVEAPRDGRSECYYSMNRLTAEKQAHVRLYALRVAGLSRNVVLLPLKKPDIDLSAIKGDTGI